MIESITSVYRLLINAYKVGKETEQFDAYV